MPWPIKFDNVLSAEHRIRSYLAPTPLRSYPLLDDATGMHVLVKHENHQPTGAFKVRNALSVLTGIREAERRRGVVAASMGNYGQGLAWAGLQLDVPITICLPHGVNPDKVAGIRRFGAELIEDGEDFKEASQIMEGLVQQRGLYPAHGVNHPLVLAGAGTITLEVLDQIEQLNESFDAMVIAVGGGSQAVGAMTVLRSRYPQAQVYGVQAEGAPTMHEAWKRREPMVGARITTFAEGLSTRQTYEQTFGALCGGLAGFVLVSDAQIAEAMRLIWRTTHTLLEPAGAAGVAALATLEDRLRDRTVAVIFSGANVDLDTASRVLSGQL